jgi:thrombospondin 2/3/4/5
MSISYAHDDSGFYSASEDDEIDDDNGAIEDGSNDEIDDDNGAIEDGSNDEIDDDNGAIEDGSNDEFIQDNDDRDKDGITNGEDNCVDISNPDQNDSDGDELGDACDDTLGLVDADDRDKDGVANGEDNCVDISNPDQNDSDGDELGDACDSTFGDAINHTKPISSGLTVNNTKPNCSNTVSLDIKNRDDVEINVQRGESVCIESEDGVWHGELCDGPYAGNVKIEVENARVIYTPSEDTSLHDDLLIIC